MLLCIKELKENSPGQLTIKNKNKISMVVKCAGFIHFISITQISNDSLIPSTKHELRIAANPGFF